MYYEVIFSDATIGLAAFGETVVEAYHAAKKQAVDFPGLTEVTVLEHEGEMPIEEDDEDSFVLCLPEDDSPHGIND